MRLFDFYFVLFSSYFIGQREIERMGRQRKERVRGRERDRLIDPCSTASPAWLRVHSTRCTTNVPHFLFQCRQFWCLGWIFVKAEHCFTAPQLWGHCHISVNWWLPESPTSSLWKVRRWRKIHWPGLVTWFHIHTKAAGKCSPWLDTLHFKGEHAF